MVTSAGIDVPGNLSTDGMTTLQTLTLMPGYSNPGGVVNPSQTSNMPVPNIPMVFAFFIILFVAWHFASEHEKSELKPQHMRVGVHNWLLTGIFAMTFIVFFKVVMNKVNSSGPFASAMRNFANAS